ncbi:MAG: UDP-N-acetylmuramoyl-L-alanine--D-glutamate ligase [Bacilli bacterium]|nr:UDP-N-acetylmuramoyl-L-alanine--D-glutamate ligase [Bacilli bacterium]
MYKDNKIFILGMARSGYEVAKVLLNRGNKVVITDAKEQNAEHVDELKKLGASVIITTSPEELLDKTFDYVVKNPGITYEHKCILKADELKITVVNEMEVTYNLLPENVSIVGITGSNGKTTTTTLTYELIRATGKRVHIGGNIGVPFAAMLKEINEGDIIVVEISAQQLHDFKNFRPNIGVITNLTETHLDFFKTYENYVNHKLMVFKNSKEEDIAIINMKDIDTVGNIKPKKIYFSSSLKSDVYIENEAIYYNEEEIIKLNDIRVKGSHNYENIMCAIIAAKEYGVTNDMIKEVLNNFSGVEHRLEYVKKLNNREFFNDSKATNVISTQVALSAFNKPVILLLGGLDRGHSFDELGPYLTHVKGIVSFGETKNRIAEFAKSVNIDCVVVEKLNEAVKAAYNLSDEGDIILLSPACASWDQYPDFESRGKDFKDIVEKLI